MILGVILNANPRLSAAAVRWPPGGWNAHECRSACPPGNIKTRRHISETAVHEDIADNTADLSQHDGTIRPDTHVRISCVQVHRRANAVALTLKSKASASNDTSSNGTTTTLNALSGLFLRRKAARRWSGSTAVSGLAPRSSNQRVAVPVPAPISRTAASRRNPHAEARVAYNHSGYPGRELW
jgi:hypothetical protein